MKPIRTLGELKKAEYRPRSVKDEMRLNLIEKLKEGEDIFPGIIGFEKTVIPGIVNAVLSRHDFILLGLRGQAKTRILRSLVSLLDEYIPVVSGSEINDNPFDPVSKAGRESIKRLGDETEITWLHRKDRYREKLATPDVTITDLIGDVDPIKAASKKLSFSDEEVIHYGIIPRTNRGIFTINELPDLPPRIQVGLLNILEESDIQIRGFPVRIPLDFLMVFSANPEDYTNRGNIITPLKDRIDSQILTHYPRSIEDAMKITSQEAWIDRPGDYELRVPKYFRKLLEAVAFKARKSEYVDQASGVSARMPITLYENVLSNMERRALREKKKIIYPRISDLHVALTAITGKIELVYEGEQEGAVIVSKKLIGKTVKDIFIKYFPKPDKKELADGRADERIGPTPYQNIFEWFSNDKTVEISDELSYEEYFQRFDRVKSLQILARKYLKIIEKEEVGLGMELILEGLHQHLMLSKREVGMGIAYKDMLKAMFDRMTRDKNN